jgi:phosphohistidine phosphatase
MSLIELDPMSIAASFTFLGKELFRRQVFESTEVKLTRNVVHSKQNVLQQGEPTLKGVWMRTLYLLRHAKSSWKDESLVDFERPLAGRGRRACETIAGLIRSEQIEFDLLLSSTAVRARETIERIKQLAKLRTELRFDERIYEASTDRLLEVISQIENDRKNVLLIGHNPSFEELLQLITGEAERMPTACLAKIKLKISKWSEVGANQGTLEWIVRPKELEVAE